MNEGYLASRYSRREELCIYRKELESRGHVIRSRWLSGSHQVHGLEASRAIEDDGPIPAEQAVLFANDDVQDILASSWMINFTEEPRAGATRGGRHVELGIYLGLKFYEGELFKRRKLYVVGALENIFHCIAEVDGRFQNFNVFLGELDAGNITL